MKAVTNLWAYLFSALIECKAIINIAGIDKEATSFFCFDDRVGNSEFANVHQCFIVFVGIKVIIYRWCKLHVAADLSSNFKTVTIVRGCFSAI